MTTPAPCETCETINRKLADRNTKISPTLVFGDAGKPGYVTPTIMTELVEKRRGARPVNIIPTFCPFCGKPYAQADVAPASLSSAGD